MNHKETFLKELNETFAKGDIGTILDNVTDDIRWEIIGDTIIEGKEAFTQFLLEMESEGPVELSIRNIITHGEMASVDGTMTSRKGKSYGFCDVYRLEGYKNPKVKEMTSYIRELKGETKPQRPTEGTLR